MNGRDSLDQHRRELDAAYEAMRAVREYAHRAAELDAVVVERLDRHDDELRALSNRVEALTRAIAEDPAPERVEASS